MVIRALAAEVAGFDILLGVIPCAARIGHHDGEDEAGSGCTHQHTGHTVDAESKADDQRDDNRHQGGGENLLLGALGAEVNAGVIIRLGGAFHQAPDLPELAADLSNDAHRGLADRGHGHRGKDEREHRANEEADKNRGIGDREVENQIGLNRLALIDIGGDKGKRGEGGGTDGKALAGGGGGVAERVEGVGAVTDAFLHAGHFGDAARVVGHGAIGVGRQRDAEGGEHADGGQADSEQARLKVLDSARAGEAGHNGNADDDNRNGGGHHAQGKAADNDGGGAGLGGLGKLLGGLIGIRGVVFGEIADQVAGQQADEDRDEKAGLLPAEGILDEEVGGHRDDGAGDVGAFAEGAQQAALAGVLAGLDEEGADDRGKDADRGERHRDSHAHHAEAGGNGKRRGGETRARVGLVEVGAHARHVTDIVPDVIGDDGRVAGVVLGDAGLNLADEVGADVGRLGEDAAADAGEQRHHRSAHSKGEHQSRDLHRLLRFGKSGVDDVFQEKEPQAGVKQPQSHDGEAHDRPGGESHLEAAVEALACRESGSGIGGGGDFHADIAGERREEAAGHKGKGHENFHLSHEAQGQHQDKNNGEELCDAAVLPLEVGVRALADRRRDLLHQLVSLAFAKHLLCADIGEDQRRRRPQGHQ